MQVLKTSYEKSDPKQAMELGKGAIKDRDNIFRINPGKQAVIFPEKHPYYNVLGKEGKEVVKEIMEEEKAATRELREKTLKDMERLLDSPVNKETENGEIIKVGFRRKSNRHLYSDTFIRAQEFKKEDLKNIDEALRQATFVKKSSLFKKRDDGIVEFVYFKDKHRELYYNVALRIEKDPNSKKMEKVYFLYSINNRLQ